MEQAIKPYLKKYIHTYISINVCMHDQSELSYPHSFAMYFAKKRERAGNCHPSQNVFNQ